MLVAAWIGEATSFPYHFLLWAMAYWYSCEVSYYYWFDRGEVLSEKIKAITSVFAVNPVIPLGWFVSSTGFILYAGSQWSYRTLPPWNDLQVHYSWLLNLCCYKFSYWQSSLYLSHIWLQVHGQNVSCSWTIYTSVDSRSSFMGSIRGIVYTWLVRCHSSLKFCTRSILNVFYYSIRST